MMQWMVIGVLDGVCACRVRRCRAICPYGRALYGFIRTCNCSNPVTETSSDGRGDAIDNSQHAQPQAEIPLKYS